MKRVVIIGGTRGIGLGLAHAFLERGCRVAVCGRDQAGVDAALAELGADRKRLIGVVCDVTKPEALNTLWANAARAFGAVDIWVHNAAVAVRSKPVEDLGPADIAYVIDVNLSGSILSARCAVRGFTARGHGALFLMQGLGGGPGPVVPGTALYGATKAGVRYLTRVLAKEAQGTGIIVGALGPGIVPTALATGGDLGTMPKSDLRFVDQFGDRVETVTPYLVDQMLKIRLNGVFINWLTPWRMAWRMLIWPVHKRRVFSGSALDLRL